VTVCADCRRTVRDRDQRVYVGADGSVALVVCPGCASQRPASRTYQPSEPVSIPRVDLSDRGRTERGDAA
jgi:hypothetical protein